MFITTRSDERTWAGRAHLELFRVTARFGTGIILEVEMNFFSLKALLCIRLTFLGGKPTPLAKESGAA